MTPTAEQIDFAEKWLATIPTTVFEGERLAVVPREGRYGWTFDFLPDFIRWENFAGSRLFKTREELVSALAAALAPIRESVAPVVEGELRAEAERLKLEIIGLNKSNTLLFKGTESIAELYDGEKHARRELETALRPFAELGGPWRDETTAYHDLEDDVDLYENSGRIINAGHVRAARKLLKSPPSPDGKTEGGG